VLDESAVDSLASITAANGREMVAFRVQNGAVQFRLDGGAWSSVPQDMSALKFGESTVTWNRAPGTDRLEITVVKASAGSASATINDGLDGVARDVSSFDDDFTSAIARRTIEDIAFDVGVHAWPEEIAFDATDEEMRAIARAITAASSFFEGLGATARTVASAPILVELSIGDATAGYRRKSATSLEPEAFLVTVAGPDDGFFPERWNDGAIPEIMRHEFAHKMLYTYIPGFAADTGEARVVNEHVADVFALMASQPGDWTIGEVNGDGGKRSFTEELVLNDYADSSTEYRNVAILNHGAKDLVQLLGATDEQRGRDMVAKIYWDVVSNRRISANPPLAELAAAVIEAAGDLYGPDARSLAQQAWSGIGITGQYIATTLQAPRGASAIAL
jgi:hypothetical protein